MNKPPVTHVGFSDESNWNRGRYRSLGLLTTSMAELKVLEDETKRLLHESNVREFKWKKLDGAKERFAALKLCEFAIENCCLGKLRINVLTWDIDDRRHKIFKRDDIANLQRMYYHLFRNVFRIRWPNNAVWRLYPDQHTAMNWNTVRDCLKHASARIEVEKNLFTRGRFRIRLRRDFRIEEISPSTIHKHPLLNIIDLFAGLAFFSYEKYGQFVQWEKGQSTQKTLFQEVSDKASLWPSNISIERFEVLNSFYLDCKKRRLGVSLKSKKGLWTPIPAKPLNFWMYRAQHPLDRAPQRVR